MKIYSDIFFWLGGVLTETIPELTRSALFPEADGHEAVRMQQKIRDLIMNLSLGKITSREFCERAIARCESSIPVSNLDRLIVDTASLKQPVADMVVEIPEAYERWLIVDFPIDWFRELANRLKIDSLFPFNRTIFTVELEIQRMVPEVFYHLPSRAGRAMDDCIVIDPVSARAVEAMKHGLAAIIFVYPERLKHELAMQGIWQTDANVLHPTSSERVNF
jgi:hypothetical protein